MWNKLPFCVVTLNSHTLHLTDMAVFYIHQHLTKCVTPLTEATFTYEHIHIIFKTHNSISAPHFTLDITNAMQNVGPHHRY